MKKIAVLGSTGSIGTQTIDILNRYRDRFDVKSLVAYSNATLLDKQSRMFNAEYTALISRQGEECLVQAVKDCDLAVVATRGICAIDAVLYCLDNGIDVALANKETLVCAGRLVCDKLKKSNSKLLPIDSEHFAISQCLVGRDISEVDKLLLTASGGPFRCLDKAKFADITPKEALKHPNWTMGQKITIDSATMFNKALEVVEALWLFGVDVDKIQIVVHPQSVVHSMVQFVDGAVMAQLATPDMRLPIQRALLGEAGGRVTASVDFDKLLTLTFERCDFDKFPCAKLGYEIFRYPELCATVMNASNDACVEQFLQGRLSFDKFYDIIISTVEHFANTAENCELTVANVKLFEKRSRAYAYDLINGAI